MVPIEILSILNKQKVNQSCHWIFHTGCWVWGSHLLKIEDIYICLSQAVRVTLILLLKISNHWVIISVIPYWTFVTLIIQRWVSPIFPWQDRKIMMECSQHLYFLFSWELPLMILFLASHILETYNYLEMVTVAWSMQFRCGISLRHPSNKVIGFFFPSQMSEKCQ